MVKSQLLLLPAELRAIIYQHLFDGSGSEVTVEAGDPSKGLTIPMRPNWIYRQYSAVLLTCKTTAAEAQPVFASSIELTFEYCALPSDLGVFAQKRYLAHIQHVTIEYDHNTHFEVAELPSLKLLKLTHGNNDSLFADCHVRFQQFSDDEEEESLIDSFFDGANDDQLKVCARDRYLQERSTTWISEETGTNQRYITIDDFGFFGVLPWVADALHNKERSFKIVSNVWGQAFFEDGRRAREFGDRQIDYDLDTLETIKAYLL